MTDMSELFASWNGGAAFNEDIGRGTPLASGGWDVLHASAFQRGHRRVGHLWRHNDVQRCSLTPGPSTRTSVWAVGRYDDGGDERQRSCLRPGPRLVRGRRRGNVGSVLRHPILNRRQLRLGRHSKWTCCPMTGYVMDDDSIRRRDDLVCRPDRRRGDVRTHLYVGNWGVDGHVALVACVQETWTSPDEAEYWEPPAWLPACSAASAFNEDIGAWDTSGVTRMSGCSPSPRPSTRTSVVGHLTASGTMEEMFESASAFDQDLGWCVDDDVDLDPHGHPCARRCAVSRGAAAPSRAMVMSWTAGRSIYSCSVALTPRQLRDHSRRGGPTR